MILRNAREESNGLTLYGLTHNDPSFSYGRVCWNQKMNRNELLTALNYCKAALMLHRGLGTVTPTTRCSSLVLTQLQRVSNDLGIQTLRDNTYRFFEGPIFWGIKGVKAWISPPTCAPTLSTFWRACLPHMIISGMTNGLSLTDASVRSKSFPLDDPSIMKPSPGFRRRRLAVSSDG